MPLEIVLATGKPDVAIPRHEGTALVGADGSIRFDTAFAGPTPKDEPMASSAFILDLASLLDAASVSHEDFSGLSFWFYGRADLVVGGTTLPVSRGFDALEVRPIPEPGTLDLAAVVAICIAGQLELCWCRARSFGRQWSPAVQCNAAGQAPLKLKTRRTTARNTC